MGSLSFAIFEELEGKHLWDGLKIDSKQFLDSCKNE